MTTTAQSMKALEYANAVRLKHAAARRKLRALDGGAARVACAAMIEEPDEMLARIRIGFLMVGMHRWGRARVANLCERLRVPEKQRLVDLTPRQRDALVSYLRDGSAGLEEDLNGFVRAR